MDEEEGTFFDAIEDDYDALNDETFGDTGGEYKWEDPKGIFDFEDDNKKKLLDPNGVRDELKFESIEQDALEETFEDPIKESENDYYDDNNLEESISRLVFDDDDEDEEENKSRYRMLKSKNSYTYFTPPQVAKKHLQWYAEKEYGSSLLGSSVWSAEPLPSPAPPIQTQEPSSSSSNHLSNHHHLDKGKSNQEAIAQIGPPPGLAKPSGFKTVDEVERELLQETEKKPEKPSAPRILSLEEVERELMQGTSVKNEKAMHSNADSVMTPPRAVPPPKGDLSFLEDALKARGLPQPPPPGMVGMQMTQGFPPRLFPMASPPKTHQFQQQQQQQHPLMRPGQMPQFATIPYAVRIPPPRPGHMHGPQFEQQGSPLLEGGFHHGGMRPNLPLDPDSGLMNEKDKQRLINIQIIQLQNDHPHPTDYYSLMSKIKKAPQGDANRNKIILDKLYPRKGIDPNKNTYQPATFENCLGKLQAISALAPRKALDTVISLREKVTSRKALNNPRYLYLEIERLYDCLLTIEESDIRLSVLGNGDEEEILNRKKSTDKVLKVLSNPLKLDSIMATNKGKLLICRLIPLMEQKVKYNTFNYILGTYKLWASASRKDNYDVKCYPYLRHCIFDTNQMALLEVVAPLDPQDFISTRLGLSVLLAMLYQAETLIGKCLAYGKPCDEFIKRWEPFLSSVVKSIFLVLDDLEAPVEIFANVLIHLQRFKVEKQYIEIFNTKLRHWAEVGGSRVI